MEAEHRSATGEIRISVVLPAYGAGRTLQRVLEALDRQMQSSDREAYLVESSGDVQAQELAASYPWMTVLAQPARTLPGLARNLGAMAARGSLLAFLDADAVPEPGWLDALDHRLTDDVGAVAGAVLNGTPWHPVGTAAYLLEFANWLPERRRPLVHGASCNLLVRRSDLDSLGGFDEDLFPGEDTLLTFALAKLGRLAFAPEAGVRHLNRTGLTEYLRHQRRLGMAFASVCRRVDFPNRAFTRPRLLPLAVPLRLIALARRLVRSPDLAAKAVIVLPLLIAGTVAWAVGVARTPVTGPTRP